MHYQILNILRRFISGPVGRWLAVMMLLLPLVFILSRFLGLSRQAIMMVMFGLLAIFVLIWAIGLLKNAGKGKRAKNFENDLGQHTRAPASQEEIREAVGELSDQWKHAMMELKEARHDIYELPWFMLIGEPQSGKSTTLRESGLEFPIGQDALSGAGGTRNCDWWFTEEAVILDTAGRFSFQEEAAPDRQEWEHFLSLLKKHRRECPINGVLVVVPATSLTEDTAEEQEEKAKNIRKKLFELQKQLEIRFPVFVLITKADRILGFTEFFAPLDPHDKGQIFGWSESEEATRWDSEGFGALFGDLVRRMHKIRLRLLRSVPDSEQADRMFVFPEELAALEEPLHKYLDTIFRASRFEEPLILRGFYLTSGMQEGRPIARACRDLLRVQAGDPQGVLEDLQSIFTRQYAFFIRDLYEKKIFPEQGLVRQTLKAVKKTQRNRRVFYGLIGAGVVAAFLLLLPALIHMAQVLRPINNLTESASACIERAETDDPCSVRDTWELVHKIERVRGDLSTSRWKIRILLQGGINNEISNELLPTVQAGLMRNGVLLPLLESFEARSNSSIWKGEEPADYENYFKAFETRLRFDSYQQVGLQPEDKEKLRQDLTIGPLLRFVADHPGLDPTIDGEDIDIWLSDSQKLGDVNEIEAIFQSVLNTEERFDLMNVGRLGAPQQSLETFKAYWTIEALASWNFQLISGYLNTFQQTYEQILAIDPVNATGEATLASFADLGSQLSTTLDNGRDFFASAPTRRDVVTALGDPLLVDAKEPDPSDEDTGLDTSSDEDDDPPRRRRRRSSQGAADTEAVDDVLDTPSRRPGSGMQAWQANCSADFAELLSTYGRLVAQKDIDTHCRVKIPEDWRVLMDRRTEYNHLYEEGDEGNLQWTEGAETVGTAFANLARLSRPSEISEQRSHFEADLANQTGDDGKLDVLERFFKGRRDVLWGPVDQLVNFDRSVPDVRFEAPRARDQAALAAALAAGLQILPPAQDYLVSKFSADCRSCFNTTYADSFVPPANSFLGWANVALGPANPVQEVWTPLNQINRAVYDYLEAYIDGQGSGGGGGGFRKPTQASQASSWSRFSRAIQNWNLTAEAPVARNASGLTQNKVQEYARANSYLQPLVDKMSDRRPRSTGPKLDPELERTIESYRRTIEVLDDNALAAWKQLARGDDGASLEDFHAFSRNRRLQRNGNARWLVENIEAKGAALLSEEIRPDYEDAAADFWRDQDICCRGRYPFITEGELQRQRLLYERGYLAATDSSLWLEANRTRNNITVPIQLDTASEDEIDRFFFPGGSLDRLFDDFLLDVLLATDRDGNPRTTIDFVGRDGPRLRVLQGWQNFLYGDDDSDRRRVLGGDQEITVVMQENRSTGDNLFIGERAVQVDLFSDARFRPSTDAGTGRTRRMTLRLDERVQRVSIYNESTAEGWVGHLEIQGGPLKLLYFIHLASEGARAGNREWEIRVEAPSLEDHPNKALDAIFDINFERPLPGVLPNEPNRRK